MSLKMLGYYLRAYCSPIHEKVGHMTLVGVLKPLFIDDIKSTWMFLVLSREFFPVRLLGLYPLPLFNSFNHCISQWRKNKYSPRCWNENQVQC